MTQFSVWNLPEIKFIYHNLIYIDLLVDTADHHFLIDRLIFPANKVTVKIYIRLFHHLRAGIMGNAMNLPGKGGRKISVAAYRLSQKVVGFN